MDDPDVLTDVEKQAFREITDDLRDEASNKLLEHQLVQVKRWLKKCERNGYTPVLADLTRQMLLLEVPRSRLMAAHAAALWRLTEEDRTSE